MKKLYHFILLIIISFSANAQIVEISANPGSSGNIVIGQSNYHVSESIYLDSEIGASNFLTSGTSITKIAFSVNTNTSVVFPITINNVKISIKNTTTSSLTSGANNTTGYTVVFSGSITFSGTGWKTLPLSTSFVRTAGQNLQLKIERSDNISNSGLVFDAAMGNSTLSTATSSRRYNGTASITTSTALTPTFFRPSIQFIRPFPTDAQATVIINPVNSCFNTNQTVKVAVKNNGTTAIAAGAASVNLSITGANTSITTSTNTSIIPVDSTALVVFNGINLNTAGLNQETAIVNIASDGYRANDTATSSVTTATILSSLPQTEDVEGQFNVFAYLKAVVGTNAWTVLSFISNSGAFNNGWNLDSLTTRPNGTGADFFIFDSYDAAPGTVSRLFSNCITLPSTGASRVSFWMSHDSAFATNLDSLYVSASNNKGASWTRIKGFRRPDASLIEYSWSQDSVDISAYNGQTIQLAFEGVSAFGNAFGLDDIYVYNVNICLPTRNTTTTSSCNSYTWVANNNTVYTTSGTYIRNYINACGLASADTLKLTINQGTFTSVTRSSCVSYTWPTNGTTYSNSGTYVRNYTNASGCPSRDTLKLTINQGTFTSSSVGSCGSYTWSINNQTYSTNGTYIRNYTNTLGCASADTLKLTINRGTFTSNTITSCGSYIWSANGQTYNSSGVYIRTYSNSNGCASADTLKLTINLGTFTSTSVTNCGSYTWTANGQTYSNSGTYIRTYINTVGCSSADTLNLTINQGTFTSTTIVRCGSYTWTANNQTYNASGVFIRTYTNVLGCPSADTLKLTINQGTFTSITVSNCGTYIWTANGLAYSTSGTYIRNYTNGQGCLSVDTLKLTINQGTFTSTTVVSCDSYTWSINNQIYTATGVYVRPYNNTTGCLSADTLKLTINRGTYNSTTISSCGNYVWNGVTYTSSGIYTKNYTNTNGCASADTLKLTVNQGSFTSTSITNCGSYVWNGVTYSSSGIYTRTYTNGGCASVDTLKLIINQGTFISTSVTSCGSYIWNGNTYSSTGTYTKSYNNGSGCASVDTLKLTINQGTFTSVSVASCVSYIWNGNTYTTSGIYTKNYINGSGCASTDTLNLTIKQGTFTSTSIFACGSYVWNGNTYTSSGTYTKSYSNGSGCASVDTLKLTINQGIFTSTSATSCGSYVWNGVTYTSSGTYTKSYNNGSGCASVDTLKLTINQGTFTSTSATSCGSYVWNGNTFTSSGTYTKNYTNASGCFSVDTLKLIIYQGAFTSINVSNCGSYVWNGITYTSSGTYTRNYNNGSGCASTDTLKLTINQGTFTSISISNCESYVWNGNTYTSSGTYTYNYINSTGCASVDTLRLTINSRTNNSTSVIKCGNYTWPKNGQTYTSSGTYTYNYINSAGCNSTDTLHLSITPAINNTNVANSCGPYLWTTNGNTYTISGTYYYSNLNCGTTDTLKLTVNQGTFSSINVLNCGNYVWNGNTYTTSGTYTRTYTNGSGCISFDTLKLTVNQGTYTSTSVTNCGSYVWNGVTYISSGIYTKNYTNNSGCASVDTLKLTINQGTFTSTVVNSCGSYIWNGNTYTSSGIYTKNYTNNSGCSSVDTLKLTINQGTFTSTSVNNCVSYIWNSNTYTLSGTYTRSYINGSGCNSVDTLKLTINQGTFTSTSATSCGSYVWNGSTYTSSGTYTKVYSNTSGCLSVDTLKLSINQGTFLSTSLSNCGSYVWNSNTYTSSGTYTRAYTNGSGCTSVDTLKLTINQGTYTSTSVTDCASYIWNGVTYTSSGIYTKNYTNGTGCASVDTLKLTINNGSFTSNSISACSSYIWNGVTYTTSGIYTKNYTNNSNCFSVDTLQLTINQGTYNLSTTVSCENYTWNGNTYTSSGTYTRIYTNGVGCSSVDTLKLTITSGTFSSASITACENYIWNGVTFTTSGVYTKTYSNVNGCLSVDTLKLTINQGTYSSTSVANCGSYTWNANGQTYNTSGTYTRVYTNGLGCTSVDTLKLTINQGTYASSSITNCGSYSWPTNGQTYNASGNYIHTYFNSLGCPSADTLKLTINQGTYTSTSITNCGSYTWLASGQTYNASGTYTRTYTNNSGCSSTDTLKLTINQGTYTSTSVTNCGSYTWSANGQSYNASGNYVRTFTNGLGCPSADTLKLTITQATYTSASVTTCGSYTWSTNGQTYNISGTYVRNYINGQGCSSADTLKLIITQGTFTSTAITVCDSYTWNVNAQTYTTSGIYLYSYNNNFGCPSVDTLKLTINQGTFTSTNITTCESYTWNTNGQTYTVTGTYIRNYTNGIGCPSADTLHLWINQPSNNSFTITSCDEYTWSSNGQTYTTSGTYTRTYINGLGCSSTDTLSLTINFHTDSTEAVTATGDYIWPLNGELYTESGTYYYTISESNRCILVKLNLIISKVQIYPNPTTGIIKLNLSTLEIPDGIVITISVFDRIGRLVKKQTTLSNTLNEVDLTPYTNGLYIIRVQSAEQIYFSSKIIKQSIN